MTEQQFRNLVTALLVLPLIFSIDALLRPIRPNSGDSREVFYPVLIIPILFLAYSVWVYPQYIQEMFGPFRSENLLKDKQLAELLQSISPQKKNIVLISAAVFGILVFCTAINIAFFTLRTTGENEKADTIPTSRSGILPMTSQLDERMPYPNATNFETASVKTSPTVATSTLQPEPTASIGTPPATAGVTPSGTARLTATLFTTTPFTPTPSVSPTQQACSVGIQCVVNGVGVTVVNVSRINSIDATTPGTGNIYLALNVIIQNVNSGEIMLYGPAYFSVQDANGAQYPALSIAPEPVLSSGQLPQGGTADGNIAFEVKSALSGYVVFYTPPALNGLSPIRIGLGQ
jgi:hypothetical protein